jgi:hypothetical protein
MTMIPGTATATAALGVVLTVAVLATASAVPTD